MSTELEIMPEGALEEVRLVVQQTNIGIETANSLQSSFLPLFKEARSVLEKSRGITVTDASQKLEIKLARECRLELRRIRTTGDKLRRELKDESLRRGRAIDGFQNILLHLTAEEEERLDAQEKFVERQEAQRKAELQLAREQALQPFGLDTTFYRLGEMSDQSWSQLLENTQAAHEAKLATERKAQEDRIRLENERLKEEARIREENSRLQREAQEREAAARKEREETAAREKAQREAAESTLRAERAKAAKAIEEAAEKARKERDAAIEANRLERIRVQAQADIDRQRAKKAQEEAEAKAAAERAAREKLEQEAAAAKQAEAQKARAAAEAARQAALAPDRDKLLAVAAELRYLKVPPMQSEAAKEVVIELLPRITKLAVWIETEASRL